jgi:serine/threonine protein kinase
MFLFFHQGLTSSHVLFRNFEIIKRIAYDVILGLSYLNRRDVVHRSLSLENVLLDVTVFLALLVLHHFFLCNDHRFHWKQMQYMIQECVMYKCTVVETYNTVSLPWLSNSNVLDFWAKISKKLSILVLPKYVGTFIFPPAKFPPLTYGTIRTLYLSEYDFCTMFLCLPI